MIVKVCETCGREFTPTRRGAAGRAFRFCCESCRPPTNYRDGRASHPQYNRWFNMVARCTKPQHPEWSNYGGRGITVCDEWVNDPFSFYRHLEELGPCPSSHSIDRMDNDGNYEPGNLRWASPTEQVRNSRKCLTPAYLK